jgi:hypothetical protein
MGSDKMEARNVLELYKNHGLKCFLTGSNWAKTGAFPQGLKESLYDSKVKEAKVLFLCDSRLITILWIAGFYNLIFFERLYISMQHSYYVEIHGLKWRIC